MFCEPTDFISDHHQWFLFMVRHTVMQHSGFSIELELLWVYFFTCVCKQSVMHPLLCLDCVVRGQRPSGCAGFPGGLSVIE